MGFIIGLVLLILGGAILIQVGVFSMVLVTMVLQAPFKLAAWIRKRLRP